MKIPFLSTRSGDERRPKNATPSTAAQLFVCLQKSRINAFRAVVVLAKIEQPCYNIVLRPVSRSCQSLGLQRCRRDTKMPTAVVVASIVNTSMSEAGFRQHMVEQLRDNDRSLLDKLADADSEANVVTAVLNVDEFLAYLIRRFPKAVDAAIATGANLDGATTAAAIAGSVDTAKMSEGEFMDFMLQQLDSGKIEPMVRFSDIDWEDDGDIGEDISRYPFFY
jgi:hypothetical protein